jgi:hypothetical protein
VKFIAVIFIIALATRVITNRSNNGNPAIDSKQTTVVEKIDSTKNIAKYLDI